MSSTPLHVWTLSATCRNWREVEYDRILGGQHPQILVIGISDVADRKLRGQASQYAATLTTRASEGETEDGVRGRVQAALDEVGADCYELRVIR